MGGDPAGDINHEQHDFALWEKRVDALMVLASSVGLMNTDSLRRVLEDMGKESYETMSYYERWIASVSQNMVEAGAFSTAELANKMAQVKARGATYGDATGKCGYITIGLQAISEPQPICVARLGKWSVTLACSTTQSKTPTACHRRRASW